MATINDIKKGSDPVEIDYKTRLEHKYIELLEKRIAFLEATASHSDLNKKTDRIKHRSPSADSADDTARIDDFREAIRKASNEKLPGSENKDNKHDTSTVTYSSERSMQSNGVSMAKRVKSVVTKWDDLKGPYEDVDTGNLIDDDDSDGSNRVTIFRRVTDPDNPKKTIREEIDIESPALKRLVLLYNRTDKVWSEDDQFMHQINSPFSDFIWSWEQYEEQCKPQDGDSALTADARVDLKELMTLIKKSTTMEPFFKIRESQSTLRSVKFEYLWTIFAPGTKVYSRTFMTDFQMLEVTKCRRPRQGFDGPDQERALIVYCDAFDWDGLTFRRYTYKFEIEKYDGERQIDSLDVFPVEYFKPPADSGSEKLQDELKDRGWRFWKLCKAKETDLQCRYNGSVLAESTRLGRVTTDGKEDDMSSAYQDNAPFDPFQLEKAIPRTVDINGNIIVDNFTFLRSGRNPSRSSYPPLGSKGATSLLRPECLCYACRHSVVLKWERCVEKTHDKSKLVDEFVKDEERLLFCPPKILGYALKEKLWVQFRVKDVEDIDSTAETADQTSFDHDLELDKKYKDLLLGFIKNHESALSRQDGNQSRHPSTSFDPIHGKGAGLAILLHGPPGVGKTLTAETIALATNRPLLTVSVAEIGIRASTAESKLASIFADAQRWRAVLLIDEADVFLEARTKTENPNRNALVSVLLRCLEYYHGLIILTTNRIRSIDMAVQSRMHLAIQYKPLTQVQKEAIFQKLLGKIPDKDIEHRERLHKDLKRLCRDGSGTSLNGRQIRNIVAAAYALAKHDDSKLTFDHLDRIYEMTSQFLESLRDQAVAARGRNEAD